MNKPTTIYIAGPITGMSDLNKEAFADAAKRLKGLGYIVRNPHELCHDIPKGSDWHEYMRRCLAALMECTDVVLLKGWKHSKGANLELHIAQELGLEIHYSVEEFEESVQLMRERTVI